MLLLKNGLIVRSQTFSLHQVIGNPMSTVERFSTWNIDELIILNISEGESSHDLRRDDLHQQYVGGSTQSVLRSIAGVCLMPLTFGGQIRSLEDIEALLATGADKITLNTGAAADPDLVSVAADRFGSQCIVASIDVRKTKSNHWTAYVDGGKRPLPQDPFSWAKELQERGAGEILLNSIDRDGTGLGYDLPLIQAMADCIDIPLIACGGVGKYEDFPAGILQGGADAVAAANIWHFFELSYPIAKSTCIDASLPMRPVSLGSPYFPREPNYDYGTETTRIEERLTAAKSREFLNREAFDPDAYPPVTWCSRCVYPSSSAAPLEFDQNGVCTGCLVADAKELISTSEWEERRSKLQKILSASCPGDGRNYDCVIAVSGGKDSYFQVHVLKEEFGLNPLLVTYDGNNWTDVGWRNMTRMRDAFDVDHIVVRPSTAVLKKLNRLGFIVMGDMNWHAHTGIMTTPMKIAADMRIPLVFYGEHGYLDLSGQFSMDDFPEVSYRDRLEHFCRGFEWTYFVNRDGLTSSDLIPWKYPSDQQLYEVGLRGLFLGNYVYWEANEHGPMMIEKYGFEVSNEPFERTYRTMSNLDDMHENGIHDYLKYIKFGYGRATDHASKDIRAGIMARRDAIRAVNFHDPIKPKDLIRWLDYVGMSVDEFDSIADTFRDPRVWSRLDAQWVRDTLGDPPQDTDLADS